MTSGVASCRRRKCLPPQAPVLQSQGCSQTGCPTPASCSSEGGKGWLVEVCGVLAASALIGAVRAKAPRSRCTPPPHLSGVCSNAVQKLANSRLRAPEGLSRMGKCCCLPSAACWSLGAPWLICLGDRRTRSGCRPGDCRGMKMGRASLFSAAGQCSVTSGAAADLHIAQSSRQWQRAAGMAAGCLQPDAHRAAPGPVEGDGQPELHRLHPKRNRCEAQAHGCHEQQCSRRGRRHSQARRRRLQKVGIICGGAELRLRLG